MFCSQHRFLWVDWFLILTYFPALFLKKINCFNFVKHTSCWSPGCHSAAFLHSPHKIKRWFCFLPWGTCINPFTSYQRQQPESDVISCLDFLGTLGLLQKFPCCFSPCFCLPGCLFLVPCWAAAGDISLSRAMHFPVWLFSGQLLFFPPAVTGLTRFECMR